MEKFIIDCFQTSSQCSYKSSPPVIPKLNNALGVEMEDGGRPMSPASQPQASIKQEVDHHLPDFHDNISLPVSNLFYAYHVFILIISCTYIVLTFQQIYTCLYIK